MARIRPPTEEEKKARDFTIPPGRYVLGFSWFERKSQEKPPYSDYLNAKFVTIKNADGETGKGFRERVGLMVDDQGREEYQKRVRFNVTRLQIWMAVLGIEEEFELGSVREGTEKEGDENIVRFFLNRAFVAEVERTESNGYKNNQIKRFIFAKDWTEREMACVEAWERKQAQRRRPEDDADDLDKYDNELPPGDPNDAGTGFDSEGSADDDPFAAGWG